MDLQTTGEIIQWTVNGITLLLAFVAGSMAARKKQNIAIFVLFAANAFGLFVLLSPLVAWISSIACMIWVSSAKAPGQAEHKDAGQAAHNQGKMGGHIIGIILGIGLVAAPLISFVRQEAALKDPTSQGWMIFFALFGAFMIMNNIFALFSRQDNAQPAAAPKAPEAQPQPPVASSEEEYESEEKKSSKKSADKIRCRFCDKLYSSEYNGCPYCKKK